MLMTYEMAAGTNRRRNLSRVVTARMLTLAGSCFKPGLFDLVDIYFPTVPGMLPDQILLLGYTAVATL